MSLTPWLPTVRRIRDGETVEQSTVNIPIDQLTQRDQHLYEKFQELLGKSVLISFGQPIHPGESFTVGELNIAYYRYDSDTQQGLGKCITGFASSAYSTFFTPRKSNYAFGLTKAVYPDTSTVDLYTEGLCELSVDLDDPSLGLIQKIGNQVEQFEVGPYYLSSVAPGKITKDPSGIPVYVGYAISKRKFLLHTNVDEFSQFFINFRYHVLDRVAGVPVLSAGNWSITEPDLTKLGWVNAADSGVIAPDGAEFYYNIPGLASITTDTGLDTYDVTENGVTRTVHYERDNAIDLQKNIPPVPANFIQLFVNGTIARYKDSTDPDGTYSVNEYGIWWHKKSDGLQPWSSDYPELPPADWKDTIKDDIASSRKNIFTSFSKFNPALRTQLVSSLKPFNTSTNKASNFIKFYNDPGSATTSATGDLFVDVIADVSRTGFKTSEAAALSSSQLPSYTANQAIADFKYSKASGKFEALVTPVVAAVRGTNNIRVTELGTNTGVWQIDYLSQGLTGLVDSIEPINSRLEFVGLSSYIKLPRPTTTPYGLIGKIVLPKGYINNNPLNLVFHVFGDLTLSNSNLNTVAFQFEYSSVCASNSLAINDYPDSNTIVNSLTYPSIPRQVEFSISNNYTQNSSLKITANQITSLEGFTIPANFVREDSIINFKITRVNTQAGVNNAYVGNIGVLGIYWEI